MSDAVSPAVRFPDVGPPATLEAEASCHGDAVAIRAQAGAAGAGEVLDKLAADYPKGPHDQPQSMCPAFGSLRVGLRMRRVATILSGSACCVYGLTFTSHFYGARRSVGYVPFNSETLVTGKLFEDIKAAVEQMADPAHYDAIIVTNLCVPTASGVPLRLLPKSIDGVRIVGIDVPRLRRAHPCRGEGRAFGRHARLCPHRDRAGAGARAARPRLFGRPRAAGRRTAGRDVSRRPDGHRADARPARACRRPERAGARMARALCRARLPDRGRDPPVLHRQHSRIRGSRATGGRLGSRRRRGHA